MMSEYEILMLERLRQQALDKKLIQDFQTRLEPEKPAQKQQVDKHNRQVTRA